MFDSAGNVENSQAYRELAKKNTQKKSSASDDKRNPSKKTGEKRKSTAKSPKAPRDFFAEADINPDTLDKIPLDVRRQLIGGNKVKVMADARVTPEDKTDDIFVQVEDMVSKAEDSVLIQMYNLDNREMIDLLKREAERGLDIKVITHPADKKSYPTKAPAIEELRANGIEVLTYPVKSGQFNHVKLLVVDGKKAMIGGMNWGEHSPHNRDINVMIEGPAVNKLEEIHKKDWEYSSGDPAKHPGIGQTPPHPDGDALVNVITTSRDPEDQTIGKTVIRAIDNAKERVYVQMFTFTSDEVADSMINAHKRGVDVRVMMNPLRINDFPINGRMFKKLNDAGVPVKWYVCDQETREKLHAKSALIDDDQVIIGSANYTKAGFSGHREAGVEVLSKKVNSELESIFMDDWENRTSDRPVYLRSPNTNPGG
jgi:cardiolipin synthase A/B